MTKCPYVPPHEWNVDFPHTMLRAKAIKFKSGGVDFGSKFLSSTDVHGKFAGIPVVVQVANAVNQTKPMRALMESTLHVDRNAWLPALADAQVPQCRARRPRAAGEGRRAHARQGGDLRHLLRELQRARHRHGPAEGAGAQRDPYELVEKEKCCGMPKLELGDLESVDASKRANIPVLAKYAARATRSSRRAQLHADVQAGDPADVPRRRRRAGGAGSDVGPFEYLAARRRDGLLKTDSRSRSAR
jgi:hypothetical protein